VALQVVCHNSSDVANVGGQGAKYHSAGMSARLPFAVSTCIPRETLPMDEWIPAGDSRFREKDHERMATLIGGCGARGAAVGIRLQHGR
jgi:ABC-type polysaccharide/polyol phosphate transport system ATPase subunit